jgi:ATP-dependent RNA helicase DBP3
MMIFQGLSGELVNVLREAGQVVPDDLLKFGTHVKKKVCSFL